jgi:hypothetical protein
MRNIIILGISGLALYLMWKAYNQAENPVLANASAPGSVNSCPEGFELCPDNKKCFDPKVNYLVEKEKCG